MRKNNPPTWLFYVLITFALILDSRTALNGAREAITLCMGSVIPSLFPFILLSILLTGELSQMALPLLKPISRLCRIPEGSESFLLLGLIGGYPVGAQNLAHAYKAGKLSKSAANRMLPFCNNAGPSFIFGILGAFFTKPYASWLLWTVQIFSAIATAVVLPGMNNGVIYHKEGKKQGIIQALNTALKAIAQICGWVILFRVIQSYLLRFSGCMPTELRVLVFGFLELTNGCMMLGDIGSEGIRFIVASILLSFGGFCIAMQTASVIGDLRINSYLIGKLLQCGISGLLSVIIQCIISSGEDMKIKCMIGAISLIISIFIITYLYLNKEFSSIMQKNVICLKHHFKRI